MDPSRFRVSIRTRTHVLYGFGVALWAPISRWCSPLETTVPAFPIVIGPLCDWFNPNSSEVPATALFALLRAELFRWDVPALLSHRPTSSHGVVIGCVTNAITSHRYLSRSASHVIAPRTNTMIARTTSVPQTETTPKRASWSITRPRVLPRCRPPPRPSGR